MKLLFGIFLAIYAENDDDSSALKILKAKMKKGFKNTDEIDYKCNALSSYGCWCAKLSDLTASDAPRGVPLDALDAACKEWHQCRKCNQLHTSLKKIVSSLF